MSNDGQEIAMYFDIGTSRICAGNLRIIARGNGPGGSGPIAAAFEQDNSVQARIAGTSLLAFSDPSKSSGYKGHRARVAGKRRKRTAQPTTKDSGMVRHGLRSNPYFLRSFDCQGEGPGRAGCGDSESWPIVVELRSTEGVDCPTGGGHQFRDFLFEAEPDAR